MRLLKSEHVRAEQELPVTPWSAAERHYENVNALADLRCDLGGDAFHFDDDRSHVLIGERLLVNAEGLIKSLAAGTEATLAARPDRDETNVAAAVDPDACHRLESAERVARRVDDVSPVVASDHRRPDRLGIADICDPRGEVARDHGIRRGLNDLVEHEPDLPLVVQAARHDDVDPRLPGRKGGVVVSRIRHCELSLAFASEQRTDCRLSHAASSSF